MLILTAIIFAIVALFACKENDKTEIPESLERSTWCSIIDTESLEQIKIEFTSASDATYSIITRGYGADAVKLQVEYNYTYNQPNITLTPKHNDAPTLTGYIQNLGEDYNTLNLESTDGAVLLNLTKQADKDQTIWQ